MHPLLSVDSIVTCGGLCPGLNAVVQELVITLGMYGVEEISGIRGGHEDVIQPHSWMELNPENAQSIHKAVAATPPKTTGPSS